MVTIQRGTNVATILGIFMSEIVAALQALIIVQMLNYACCQVLVDHNF